MILMMRSSRRSQPTPSHNPRRKRRLRHPQLSRAPPRPRLLHRKRRSSTHPKLWRRSSPSRRHRLPQLRLRLSNGSHARMWIRRRSAWRQMELATLTLSLSRIISLVPTRSGMLRRLQRQRKLQRQRRRRKRRIKRSSTLMRSGQRGRKSSPLSRKKPEPKLLSMDDYLSAKQGAAKAAQRSEGWASVEKKAPKTAAEAPAAGRSKNGQRTLNLAEFQTRELGANAFRSAPQKKGTTGGYSQAAPRSGKAAAPKKQERPAPSNLPGQKQAGKKVGGSKFAALADSDSD
mmetsp:Transcript_74534/g.198799  ORF Transcript_74534/g.198799 Transcript_74534/m.198799 type:complete len:288 (-) Transcript_74534:37-900(-)